MEIVGKVLNASIEERDLVGKDGAKRHAKISHVLLQVNRPDKSIEIVNLKGYDCSWELPKVGDTWTSPRIRRYENYDGQIADVSV